MAPDKGNGYPPELVESMEALSKLVIAEEDVSSTVDRITKLAVHAIEGAEVCSVTLARKDEIKTIASTDEIGKTIDQIQYDTKEGPCLSSIGKSDAFHIVDMARDDTWPTFSKRAADETGIKSMLSYVLKVHEGALGAVNLMSSKRDAFDDEDIATGAIFAVQAAVALANALTHAEDEEKIEQLKEGLKTRQLIGEAVGIVMATREVDQPRAFEILTNISQNANVKLRDIAQQLVHRTPEG